MRRTSPVSAAERPSTCCRPSRQPGYGFAGSIPSACPAVRAPAPFAKSAADEYNRAASIVQTTTEGEHPVDRRELAEKLKEKALLRGEFTLRSGRKSSYYFDKYRFETDPELLSAVAKEMAGMLPKNVERLAGAELGGVPLATALALETGLPFVIVRKEAKGYGTDNRIEGKLEHGEFVLLVEDVATTAGAALRAVDALREAGAGTVSAFVVLDREEGAEEAFRRALVPYRALFTSTSLGIGNEE